MKRSTVSERALVLAPRGRDAVLAVAMLGEAGIAAEPCASLPHLLQDLDRGAGIVVVTEEALAAGDLAPLAAWIGEQEEWSDLPFVLLTSHGGGIERNPAAKRYLDLLGNATFVERPFHPTTLVSLAQAALRGRRRQYEARARLEAFREAEARFRALATVGSSSVYRMGPDWCEMRRLDGAGFLTDTDEPTTNWVDTYIPPDEQPRVRDAIERAIRDKGAFELEHRALRVDGSVGWTHSRAIPLLDGAGEIVEWFGAASDVTARVHADQSFTRLFQASPAPFLVLKPDAPRFTITEVNDAYLAATLRTREGLVGRGIFEAFPDNPDDATITGVSSLRASLERVLATRQPDTLPGLKYDIARPDGTFEERWWSPVNSAVVNENGDVEAIIHNANDVTEQRRAEAALRESETRYRTLFEAIDAGFCIFDVKFDDGGRAIDYRFVEVNPAFGRQTGLNDAVGKWISELAPGHEQYWYDRYGEVAVTGRSLRVEDHAAALGRWYDIYAFKVGTPEQRRVAALFNDVSDRHRAEARLRELNETLERRVAEALAERKVLADIVEGTDAFVQVIDLNYRWLAINRAAADEFERIFGPRPKVGDSMLDLLADQPEHQAAVRAVWSRALAGEEFTETDDFGDPGRDRRCYEMKYNTLRGANGVRIGAYQFVYDVTERVQDQARFAETQEQLRQAQKMEAVGQLTGGVAHDFNNLLTIIKSSTDLLRRPGIADDRKRRYVDAISETVDRAAKLTGQLLAFARRQSLKPEVFDAAERIRAIADMLGTIVGSRIHIVTELAPESCYVETDVSQFETALVNMAVNARDAMREEGTLTIRVDRVPGLPAIRGEAGAEGRHIAISIKDTGAGIPSDKLAQIFEPFFTTKEVGKGTGLGLSQVYGFAKQSGGDIAVESEVGHGAAFTLYLPEAEREIVAADRLAAHEAEPAQKGHGRRVLVVEDNAEVGTFSTQFLQDLGYETTLAVNANDALKLLEEANGFDVVFSDVVMPGMSGIDLGQEIRRKHPDLPVVLTSGYSHVLAEEGRHGFELLHKPYAAEELSRVLRRVTQAAGRK